MSNFRFSFQKILDIKEKNREQVEIRYAQFVQNLNKEKEILLEFLQNKDQLQEEVHSNQIEGISIKEVSQSQIYINYFDNLIHNQKEKIKQIEEALLEKQKELTGVKIEEKKWIKLREKKWESFIELNNQLEQKELDEIATQRLSK